MIELTLRVALLATAVNLPLAVVVSWFMTRKKFHGAFVVDILISLPLALPPAAIGFFLLLLLGRQGPLGMLADSFFGVDIVFTWVAAVFASAVVSFPLVVRATMVAMSAIDERFEMSARSLGASPLRVFFTITIPLSYRGILAGLAIGFIRALAEFGATITVAGNIPGRTQTLSLAIYTSVQMRDDSTALLLAGISVSLAVITLFVHNKLLGRAKRPVW